MKEYLISVVVPIYNVQDYIRECIESIVNQTYENLEIILVDDGSTDSCPQICDEYGEKFTIIHVIHKENGGLSDARNVGTECAQGEYIFYLDGDDYLDANALSEMLQTLIDFKADLVVGNYYYSYSTHEVMAETKFSDFVTPLDNFAGMEALVSGKIQNFAWGKLIRSDIAKKHLFPKGKLFEDTYWTHLIMADTNCTIVMNEPMVHYRQRSDSISFTYDISRLDVLEGWTARKDYLKEYYPGLVGLFLSNISNIYTEIAWLILTKMRCNQKQAFIMLKCFNQENCLQNYTDGMNRKLIQRLDQSVIAYAIYAGICKVLGKLK